MAVDLAALRKAAEGDPAAKVGVTKRWLAHVADELDALERVRRRTDTSLDAAIAGIFGALSA